MTSQPLHYCTNKIGGRNRQLGSAGKFFVGTLSAWNIADGRKPDRQGGPSNSLTIRTAEGDQDVYRAAAECRLNPLRVGPDRLNKAAKRESNG